MEYRARTNALPSAFFGIAITFYITPPRGGWIPAYIPLDGIVSRAIILKWGGTQGILSVKSRKISEYEKH